MKKLCFIALALAITLTLAACGGGEPQAASSSTPAQSTAPAAPSASLPEAPASEAPPQGQATQEEAAKLLEALEATDYAFWAIGQVPQDDSLRTQVVNAGSYGMPYTIINTALWQEGGGNSEEYLASAADMKQAAADLYGIEYDLANAPEDVSAPGYYSIPAHGPNHNGELLPDTLQLEGDTYIVDTLVSYTDYELGVLSTNTLRHTFTRNPEGASFPFRVVSVRLVDSTGPTVSDYVTVPPQNTYTADKIALVDVDELNVRSGPGTDYEKLYTATLGNLLALVGDDGGEWVCTYNGWVKSEYISILGSFDE